MTIFDPRELDIVNANRKLIVGIDCGKKTGFALGYRNAKKFIDISSMKIHKAMQLVQKLAIKCGKLNMEVHVEDARKNKYPAHTFRRLSEEDKIARLQGVGSVKRDCVIWEDFLADEGFSFFMIDPRKRQKKVDKKTFKMYTGWDKHKGNNEHSRDAGMLIFPEIF